MGRYVLSGAIVVFALAISATAWASGDRPTLEYNKMLIVAISIITAGVTVAFGTVFPARAMAQGLTAAMNSVGRNPEAAEKMLLMLVVSMAMIEALAIYALVVALVIIFANPMIAFIVV